MLHPLPAETVFEARARAKRNTVLLFALLGLIYMGLFGLMGSAAHFIIASEVKRRSVPDFSLLVFSCSAAAGLILSVFQIISARGKNLDELLSAIQTVPADPKDAYHKVFLNLVAEAEAATNIRPIRPVIIPSPGSNAFSVEGAGGQTAIGVTEGLLVHLNRAELSAVLAHEAAHLANGDSRLMTIAVALLQSFEVVQNTASKGRIRGRAALISVVVMILSAVGSFVARILAMAISRQRELVADSHGVQMCKDPLALAQALHKISEGYRGSISVPQEFGSAFILNPAMSAFDEEEGILPDLLATHPPVAARLEGLLRWAKAELKTVVENTKIPVAKIIGNQPQAAGQKFFVYQEGDWKGPWTEDQILPMNLIKPSTWICPEGSQEVVQALEHPALGRRLTAGASDKGKHLCPRCMIGLGAKTYEGANIRHCGACGGHLLEKGVMERLVARRDETFRQEAVAKAKAWRSSATHDLQKSCLFPAIQCPLCRGPMAKVFHSDLTAVTVDRCVNSACGAIWCDAGELETIQILVENAAG
ncbi:MAG: hypothetical protein A2901_09695 [Elusimicrobia bacterium RIFCSPLOWO2_01_FULL_54_10]|nr:MAG: hypothetical protein A2901_09695 [Elusimicrobia bacterium RIFCSPLOWO2_01_FULL_54_10]